MCVEIKVRIPPCHSLCIDLLLTMYSSTDQVGDLNKEYDFVSKARSVVSSAASLSDSAVKGIEEANAKVRESCFTYINGPNSMQIFLHIHA